VIEAQLDKMFFFPRIHSQKLEPQASVAPVISFYILGNMSSSFVLRMEMFPEMKACQS
jgi:hypothetical protein